MRILHTVEFYHPSVGGAQEVVRQLSERLVRLGHEVTVATSRLPERELDELNGVRIEGFAVSGNAVRGISGETGRYREFLLGSDFDVIMNYAAQQWATDLMLPLLERIPARKVLVPCGYSGLYLPEYADYFENMRSWLKRYDACVYMSDTYRDIEFARGCCADNGVLIPNGAGEDEFGEVPDIDIRRKLGVPSDHLLILHVGSHTGTKGHRDAMRIFKRSGIEHATLLIVANNPMSECGLRCRLSSMMNRFSPSSRSMDKRIVVTTLPRDETVATYHAADLFLFPSSIECSPLVLFEAAASRTPFLTTDVGNASEIVQWTRGGELLPTLELDDGYVRADVDASAELLRELACDPGRRRELARSGHEAWRARFTWEGIVQQYEALYTKLLNDRPGREDRTMGRARKPA